MGVFRDTEPAGDERWKPPRVIQVSPDAFASDWLERPDGPVEMGLRRAADFDAEKARSVAAQRAVEMHDEPDEAAVDCYNDELLRYIIARSTCQVDDVRKPYFEMAEDTVRTALSTDGVRFLAHEIEVFNAETDPTIDPASDEEILDLGALLQNGPPWASMDAAAQRGARRLISVLLDRFDVALTR